MSSHEGLTQSYDWEWVWPLWLKSGAPTQLLQTQVWRMCSACKKSFITYYTQVFSYDPHFSDN